MTLDGSRLFGGVLALVLVCVAVPAVGTAVPGPTVDSADAAGTMHQVDTGTHAALAGAHQSQGGDGAAAAGGQSGDGHDAGSSDVVGEPAPLRPPDPRAAAYYILGDGYFIAVEFAGLLVLGLLAYASTALLREQTPRRPSRPTPGVPETDGGTVVEEEFDVVEDVGDDVSDDRRNVLKAAAGATTLGISGLSAAEETASEYIKKHYKKMSDAEREELVENLEHDLREEFDNPAIDVSAKGPMDDVVFGYALNVEKCVGCRRCVYACVEENNQSRADAENPAANQIQWIRVLKFEDETIAPGTSREGGKPGGMGISSNFGDVKAGIDWHESDHFYPGEEAGEEDSWYLPTQCQQCENPSCTQVCPVQATWKEEDGIVVIDYDRCIGCKYCVTNCPYGARRFNFNHPNLPEDEVNPDMHYLGNRPRPGETAEKCSFCIQRTREGRKPACVETCPVGARKFGNLLDEESSIRRILDDQRVFRLRPEIGNDPKFFYFSE